MCDDSIQFASLDNERCRHVKTPQIRPTTARPRMLVLEGTDPAKAIDFLDELRKCLHGNLYEYVDLVVARSEGRSR
jgi:hypothetical protein